jgi:cell division protein FtsB
MSTRRTPGGQTPGGRPARRAGPGARSGGRRWSALGRSAGGNRSAAGSRSATRPAAARSTPARRAAATGGARRTSAPEPRRTTGRATILFAVVVALALAYTYPVRVYLSQQTDIARMEAAQAAQRRDIDELSHRAALWQDPEYVRSKARERFYMRAPGETLLVVLWDPDGAARESGVVPENATPPPPEPWQATLWSSIQAANDERAGP